MQSDLHDNIDPAEGSSQHDQSSTEHDDSHVNQEHSDDAALLQDVSPEAMQAVENMLRELDMDEGIHHVPSAFRILRPSSELGFVGSDDLPNGSDRTFATVMSNRHDEHHLGQDQSMDSEDDEEDAAVAFGYIPLDQDDNGFVESDDDGDEEEEEAARGRAADGEDETEDAGQGFANYLVDKDGTDIVPTVPAGVVIDNVDAQEPIPEADLQTIRAIMQSFVLPPSAVPEWAKAIPEERWLPRMTARPSVADTDQQNAAEQTLPSQ